MPHSIPLLADHHSHPLLYAAFGSAVDLSDVKNLDQACDLINDAGSTESSIVVAYGWKDAYFSFPEERLTTLPPVAVFNLSLHWLLVNPAGKQVLVGHYGSEIEKLEDREWYEANLRTVLNWFALLNGSPAALVSFFSHLETLGVWSAEEMLLVAEQEIEWFDEAALSERTRYWAAPDTFESLSDSAKAKVHGLKLFTDGAIGAWTAALNQSFRSPDNGENLGMLIYSDAELSRIISKCGELGNHIAIHAIGDRAIEQTIGVLQSINANQMFQEIRMEHAQLISRSMAQQAKDLGITLLMQPNFSVDSVDYADRLPAGYAELNNPFRMLIDDIGFQPGVDLVFGSDGMPHGVDYALAQSLTPAFASQRLTLDEFKSGYCSQSTELTYEITAPATPD